MNKYAEGVYTTITSTYITCPHKKNGWYFTIKHLGFKRRYFWCEDCQNAIPQEKWKIDW